MDKISTDMAKKSEDLLSFVAPLDGFFIAHGVVLHALPIHCVKSCPNFPVAGPMATRSEALLAFCSLRHRQFSVFRDLTGH